MVVFVVVLCGGGGGRYLSLTSFPCRLAVVVFPLLVGGGGRGLCVGGGGGVCVWGRGRELFVCLGGGGGFQVSHSCFPCRLDVVFFFLVFFSVFVVAVFMYLLAVFRVL